MNKNREISQVFLLISDGRGLTMFTGEGRRMKTEREIRIGGGIVLRSSGLGQFRATSENGGALTYDPSTGVLSKWH